MPSYFPTVLANKATILAELDEKIAQVQAKLDAKKEELESVKARTSLETDL